MSSLELRVPPDLVWLATALVMWLTSRVAPALSMPEAARRGLALLLIVAGTVLIVAGRMALRRENTTWSPREPGRSTALVTTGVYRFSRNPVYLGMQVVLLSFAVVLASPVAAVFSAFFAVYVDRFQISPEELVLSVAFGQEYEEYRRRVRRWL